MATRACRAVLSCSITALDMTFVSMNHFVRLLVGVLIIGIAGCGEPAKMMTPLGRSAVVLAFGDSLTRGTGAGDNEGYPERLTALIGREVINEGVPGELSRAGLARLPGVLDRVQPALIILCHAGNDMLRKRSLETARQRMINAG